MVDIEIEWGIRKIKEIIIGKRRRGRSIKEIEISIIVQIDIIITIIIVVKYEVKLKRIK